MWRHASLQEMSRCPVLSAGRRKQLRDIIAMCNDAKLIPREEERQNRLKAALKAAHNWLETKLRMRKQQQATFMRNYAASMLSTAYHGPAAAGPPTKGKVSASRALASSSRSKVSSTSSSSSSIGMTSSKGGGKKPAKLSKADQIRQEQTEKRAAEGALKLADRWTAKQQELERAIQVTGWDAQLCADVAKFLSQCKQEAPAAYLAASLFQLENSLNAWKQACQSRRRRAATEPQSAANAGAGASAAGAPAAGATAAALIGVSAAAAEAQADVEADSSLAGAVPHAVTVWLTVQDVLSKGFLDAGSRPGQAVGKELAKKAGKLCEQAMQLLGFAQAAANISSLLAALKETKSARKGKQAQLSTDASKRPATAATAAAMEAHSAPATDPDGEKNPDASKAKDSSMPGDKRQSSSNSMRSSNLFSVGMTEAEFQLQYCGDLLQRDAPAEPDPRVISFNPDLWQRQVLDVIDANASAVVCAPTSSGKTFISSYCMDRVLRQSKDGIVVFVAPTKALVNQTAAQVS